MGLQCNSPKKKREIDFFLKKKFTRPDDLKVKPKHSQFLIQRKARIWKYRYSGGARNRTRGRMNCFCRLPSQQNECNEGGFSIHRVSLSRFVAGFRIRWASHRRRRIWPRGRTRQDSIAASPRYYHLSEEIFWIRIRLQDPIQPRTCFWRLPVLWRRQFFFSPKDMESRRPGWLVIVVVEFRCFNWGSVLFF